MSANVGYVGHHATHLVTPVEGNQPLPGVGDPVDLGAADRRRPLFATRAAHHQHLHDRVARPQRLQRAAGRASASATSKGLEYLASYTLSKVRTNNLGYYGSGGVQAEGAYWMNAYEPEWNYGPAFFDARHNFVLSANYELPFGRRRRGVRRGERHPRRLARRAASSRREPGFPITVIDGRGSSLQAVRGNERPNCVGDPTPADQNTRPLAGHQRVRDAPPAARGATAASASRARRAIKNLDAALSKRFSVGGARYAEFRLEAFNLTNTPSFGPPARDITVPNTFGTITSTVSTARTVELVLKFFF